MKNGIIMEMDDEYLTLLTPNGEFLRSKKRNNSYSIGEEISFMPVEKKQRNYILFIKQMFLHKPLPVILTALLLFLGSLIPMYENNKAYAYMSIDVNPSIELGLNKNMQVVKLNGFNSDGKNIISHISDWKKQEVSQVAREILNEMNKQGFLKQHHSMVISTVRAEGKAMDAEKKLAENINEIEKAAKVNHLKLTLLNGTVKEMNKAHDLGITTGNYQEMKMKVTDKKREQQKQVQKKNNLETKTTAPQNNKLNKNNNNSSVDKKQVLEKENKSNQHSDNHKPSSHANKEKGYQKNHHENEKKSEMNDDGLQNTYYESQWQPKQNEDENHHENYDEDQNDNHDNNHYGEHGHSHESS